MMCSPYDLKDYVFEELSKEQRSSVETHLSHCGECREELESLTFTQSALLSVREEEPPRRIAFVSDKIFQPRWWQVWWSSAPRLGFASAAMLSAAVLFSASQKTPAPVAAARSLSDTEVAQQVERAVQKAVSESEARQTARLTEVLAERERETALQRKMERVSMEAYVDVMRKRMNLIQRASYDAPSVDGVVQ